MKKRIKALMQKAKAMTDHQERKAAVTLMPLSPMLVGALVDEDQWYTFAQLAERYGLSHDKVSRDLRNREGVAKFGSDYRVPRSVVKSWLTEALSRTPFSPSPT